MNANTSGPTLCKYASHDNLSSNDSTQSIQSTPVFNTSPTTTTFSSQSIIDQPMQEIPQPQSAVLHRNTVDLCPALIVHHNESGYSVVTCNSDVSVLPTYSPPAPTTNSISMPTNRNSELDVLRRRYEEHRAQYRQNRKTYLCMLILLAITAMVVVIIAFKVSAPHIVLAIGIILIVVFVCIVHRMTVLRDVIRRERQLINIQGDPPSASQPFNRRQYPLPDDHFLVITETSHGQERRTLISGPPEYNTATVFPPAYLPKHECEADHVEQAREMEEGRVR